MRTAESLLGIGQIAVVFQFGTLQRRTAAGAALVHEDQVTPPVQPAECELSPAGDADRALPRSAGQQKDGIRQFVPVLRRHHDIADVDFPALGMGRVQRTLHLAALYLLRELGNAACLSGCHSQTG